MRPSKPTSRTRSAIRHSIIMKPACHWPDFTTGMCEEWGDCIVVISRSVAAIGWIAVGVVKDAGTTAQIDHDAARYHPRVRRLENNRARRGRRIQTPIAPEGYRRARHRSELIGQRVLLSKHCSA